MGKYLDIISRAEADGGRDISDISDKSPLRVPLDPTFCRFGRFGRTFSELERRCPDHIEPADWQQAVADARVFLARWGEQAEALGWTARDLLGLAPVPDRPRPSYRRLSRYDATGLVWLLRGRPVVALTTDTAAIQGSTGAVTYRRHHKPGLGPLGDSLDDLK